MRKGDLRIRRGSVVLIVLLLATTLLLSMPEATNALSDTQMIEPAEKLVSDSVLNGFCERSWDLSVREKLSDFQWKSWESNLGESNSPIIAALDIEPFGTPHPPIIIDENNDFETQGWPGEGSVEQPYLISGLNINSTSDGPAISITNTDVHFFIKDCWLTSNDTTVVELNSMSHGRVKNNTILESERGVTALHSYDLTIFDNLFYSFGWAGVYMENCSISTLRNNNCTTCFLGLHVEQSNDLYIEDNYCYGGLGGIDVYFDCEYINIFNNTLVNNEVGVGLYLDTTNSFVVSNNCSENLMFGIYSENCQDNTIMDNHGRINAVDIHLVNCTSYTIFHNDCGATTGLIEAGAISLKNCNHSLVSNNQIKNFYIGIEVGMGSSHNEIVNNNCSFFDAGIYLQQNAPYNTVRNNTCVGSDVGTLIGIFVDSSSYCIVTENRCNLSQVNIGVMLSNNSEVIDNICYEAQDIGIIFDTCYYALVEGNTVGNSSSGIVMVYTEYASILSNTISNCTGTSDFTGIHILEVLNSTVEGNQITECNAAIIIEYSQDCNITDNTCMYNRDGILVANSNYDIIVEDNYCHMNEGFAMVVWESFNITVIRNIVTNTSGLDGTCLVLGDCEAEVISNVFSLSDIGIDIQDCEGEISHNIIEDNELYGVSVSGLIGPNLTWNVFENNGINAHDNSDDTLFDFNYWSNYTGTDTTGDGVGDTWHPIQGTANNNDTHPLVYHPTLPDWVEIPSNQEAELGHSFSYSLSTTSSIELAPIVDWWLNDTTHFAIDGGTITNAIFLDLGEYLLEVKAINIYGFELSATFTVTVSDTIAPSIIGPDDFDYVVGQVGRSISWIAEDYDPASYSVTLDGIEVMSGAWNSTAENITISVDGLSVGDHTFVITFFDGSGNANTDTVVVTVTPADFTPLLIVAGAGGAVIVVIIVVFLIRKKGTGE